MTQRSPYEKALLNILWELRPYLDDLVVIGGWVPYLYREYGGFHRWNGRLSFTAEVDVLVERPIPAGDRPPIADLLRGAGFAPDPAVSTPSSAVWQNDPKQGEKVEFLVSHQGTARQLGSPVVVPEQRELAAIGLQGLDLLHRHTSTLKVPTGRIGDEVRVLEVHVPTLGAYVVNKASAFMRRPGVPGEQKNPKRAKDLLYLRDLLAAGDEVVARVGADLATIAKSGEANALSYAASQISLVLGTDLRARLSEVAAMLSERDGVAEKAALVGVGGYLTDLAELLYEAARTSEHSR